MCYTAGLLLSFLFKYTGADLTLASDMASVLVCIAMPLILFSADLPAMKSLAKTTLGSFGLNIAAVLLTAFGSFFVFRGRIDFAGKMSAMLVGTYTGGTPNMFAIGHALGATADELMLAQTADLIGGGIYFFCLISFMPGLLKKFLPKYAPVGNKAGESEQAKRYIEEFDHGSRSVKPFAAFLNRAKLVGIAVICVVAAMGICILIPSKYGNTGLAKLSEHTAVMMLLVTTFGIALSFVKKIRTAPDSYVSGQYFILMFSVAMGLCFDVAAVGAALELLLMLLMIQFGTVIIHMLLAKLCKIDRDTAMITSTAGVFGPAFIIPVADALDNEEMILPGLLCGILGYAIGNYLGIGVGWILTLL